MKRLFGWFGLLALGGLLFFELELIAAFLKNPKVVPAVSGVYPLLVLPLALGLLLHHKVMGEASDLKKRALWMLVLWNEATALLQATLFWIGRDLYPRVFEVARRTRDFSLQDANGMANGLFYIAIFVFLLGTLFLTQLLFTAEFTGGNPKNPSLDWRMMASRKRPKKADLQICYDQETRKPVVLRASDRFMHFFIVGPTGTGKTQGILMPMVVQDVKNHSVGLTVIEPKGDWVAGTYDPDGHFLPGILEYALEAGREVYFIDPSDPDTDFINPLVGDPDTVAEVNAAALKAEFGYQEAFFSQTQESVVKDYIKLLKYNHGDDLDYMTLVRVLRDRDLARREVNELARRIGRPGLDGTPPPGGVSLPDKDPRVDLYDIFRTKHFGSEEAKIREFTIGLRVQLDKMLGNTYFRRCVTRSSPTQREVNIDRHLASNSILLVSTNMAYLGNLSRVLGKLVTVYVQYGAAKRFKEAEERREALPPHFVYLDEFGNYVNESFGDFLTVARGYQVGVVLAVQGLGQLTTVDNTKNNTAFRDKVLTNCASKVVFGRVSYDDGKYFEREFGQVWVKTTSERTGTSYGDAGLIPSGAQSGSMSKDELQAYFEFTDIKYQDANAILYEIPVGRRLMRARRGYTRMIRPTSYRKEPNWRQKAGSSSVCSSSQVPAATPETDPSSPLSPSVPGGTSLGDDAMRQPPVAEGSLGDSARSGWSLRRPERAPVREEEQVWQIGGTDQENGWRITPGQPSTSMRELVEAGRQQRGRATQGPRQKGTPRTEKEVGSAAGPAEEEGF